MTFSSRVAIKFFSCFVSCCIVLNPCCKQNKESIQSLEIKTESLKNPVRHFAETITIEELKEHIRYLASDKLEGRHSGTVGGQLAAEYIADRFQKLKLQGISQNGDQYLQKFRMVRKKPVDCFLESKHGRVDNWDEFMEMHGDFYGEKDVDLVFAGYGRQIDLETIDVEGKLIAFFMGRPDADEIGNDLERVKIAALMDRGAEGVLLIVHDDEAILDYIRKIKPYFNKSRHYLDKSPEQAIREKRNIVITATAVTKLFGLDPEVLKAAKRELQNGKSEAGKFETSVHMKTAYETEEVIPAANVLSYIEGKDKKEECVIFTAHYDHLGKSGEEIYNGACDNAAGVAALMEIADAFAEVRDEGQSPRRSVLFLTPDAEELGGVGSKYYLDHPVFSKSKTVVDINIDEIGREDASRPELKDFVHIYLSKNGRAYLIKMRDRAVKALSKGLRLEWRENYAGSDNAFFERDKIPAIALGTGQPEDHHKPTDTSDKIDYENVQKIARLAFALAWEIANSENEIQRIISK